MQARRYRSFTIEVILHEIYTGEYTTSTLVSCVLELNKDDPTRDLYHCVFLAKYPNDAIKSDELSRFFLEWHRYTRCSTTNEIVYGDHILIRPSHYPNKERFV